MTERRDTLTELDAATAWARAYNLLDASHLEPLLAEDVHYASQWVFEEIENRDDYLAYLVPKLATIEKTGSLVRAELAETRPYPMYPNPPRPCVVVVQEGRLLATVLFEVSGGEITRIDMCQIPSPETCARSGECPGLFPSEPVPTSKGPVN